MKLSEMTCVPCRGGEPQLTKDEINALLPQVPGWEVVEVDGIQQLRRVYKFKQYLQGVAFSQRVGELAEVQDHHPAILVEWRKVTVSWWTHVVKGLHQNDFISAAKSDALFDEVQGSAKMG